MNLGKLIEVTPRMKIHNIPFNRDVVQLRRAVLRESMRLFGFIVPVLLVETDVFDGKKKRYLLDGQHRMDAARQYNESVIGYVIPYKPKSIEDVHQLVVFLNNSSAKWKIYDYVISFHRLGMGSYTRLLKFCKKYKITVDVAVKIFRGLTGISTARIKKGELEIGFATIQKAVNVIDTFEDIVDKIGRRTIRQGDLYYLIASNYPFSATQFIHNWDPDLFDEYYYRAPMRKAILAIYLNKTPEEIK